MYRRCGRRQEPADARAAGDVGADHVHGAQEALPIGRQVAGSGASAFCMPEEPRGDGYAALQREKKGYLFLRDKMQRTRRPDSAMVRTLIGFTQEWSAWTSSLKFAARNIFAESVRCEIPSARCSGSRKPKSGSSVPLTRLRFISENAISKVRVIPLVLIPLVLPEPTAFQTLPLR